MRLAISPPVIYAPGARTLSYLCEMSHMRYVRKPFALQSWRGRARARARAPCLKCRKYVYYKRTEFSLVEI